jgi:hypothetical protein
VQNAATGLKQRRDPFFQWLWRRAPHCRVGLATGLDHRAASELDATYECAGGVPVGDVDDGDFNAAALSGFERFGGPRRKPTVSDNHNELGPTDLSEPALLDRLPRGFKACRRAKLRLVRDRPKSREGELSGQCSLSQEWSGLRGEA